MKTYKIAAVLGLVGLSMASLAQTEFVPGEVLVKFKPGYELASRAARMAIGAELESSIPAIGYEKIALPPGMSVKEGVRYFKSNPYVQSAEPNGIWYADFTPNDPMFGQQYQHTKVQTPAAWDINQGNANIIIAILDSGVDKVHPDLSAKIIGGFDFVNNDPDAQDDFGHGTHVAGLAAASTNNGVGVAGTGFNCKIMPVKVLSSGGGGTFEWVASGITFAADNGAKVINMSLGGPSPAPIVETAVNYALTKGCVVVASAGNNGNTDPNYPGFYAGCIAVASTNQNDQRSGFSTYGNWVDVAAPGDAVLSTLLGGGYGNESGTSMAAPVTAGVVGLIWAHSPLGTTNTQVRATLENNCDNVGNFVIKGRINAFKALNSIGTFIDVPAWPSGVEVHTGTYVGGDTESLAAADGNTYRINSVQISKQGSVAAAAIEFTSTENFNTANKVSFQLNGAAVNGVTGMFYMYKWSTGQWVHVKSFPMKNTNTAATVDAAKPYPQWISGGKVRILYRSIAPERLRLNYQLKIDQTMMTVRKRVF